MLPKSADWTGVIVIGSLEINCQAFSVKTKKARISLLNVHTKCVSPLSEPETEEEEEKGEQKQRITPVARELFCNACQKPVPVDEQGKAFLNENGELILLTEDELQLLKPEQTKRVITQYISSTDPLLEALSFSRRLYLFPKPTSINEYYKAWETLAQAGRYSFSNEIVIKKESYPIIIKPIKLPPEMADGRERKLLVMDAISDPLAIKKTSELFVLPDKEPSFQAGELAELIMTARHTAISLTIDSLINPKQKRLAQLIKKKKRKRK